MIELILIDVSLVIFSAVLLYMNKRIDDLWKIVQIDEELVRRLKIRVLVLETCTLPDNCKREHTDSYYESINDILITAMEKEQKENK